MNNIEKTAASLQYSCIGQWTSSNFTMNVVQWRYKTVANSSKRSLPTIRRFESKKEVSFNLFLHSSETVIEHAINTW